MCENAQQYTVGEIIDPQKDQIDKEIINKKNEERRPVGKISMKKSLNEITTRKLFIGEEIFLY